MDGDISRVKFYFNEVRFSLKNRNLLKKFISKILKQEKRSLQAISFIFCGDKFLLSLNRKYLHHDYYTDIITFDLSIKRSITGEIYISIDRVRDNASMLKLPFKQELLRVIFHGILHLCAYRDETSKQKLEMTRRENIYLRKYLNLERSTGHCFSGKQCPVEQI